MSTSRCVVQSPLVNLSDTRVNLCAVVMDVKLFSTTWVARTSLFGDRGRGGCFFRQFACDSWYNVRQGLFGSRVSHRRGVTGRRRSARRGGFRVYQSLPHLGQGSRTVMDHW